MPWPLPNGEAARLALARSYPFDAPEGSFLFRGGVAHPLSTDESGSRLFDGRTPVIAHGSNRAPQQLRRKFGDGVEIPVTRAWLGDHDVVYSAHVTQYGSIAANLRHAPGVRVAIFVTWLDRGQLARMHETELGGENYFYGCLAEIDLVLEAGPAARLAQAHVYLSTRGCLADGGGPIALAAVAASGRAHGALDQGAILELARARHRPDEHIDTFILRNMDDSGRRAALIAEMGEAALPMHAPNFHRLES